MVNLQFGFDYSHHNGMYGIYTTNDLELKSWQTFCQIY